jgi:hypothetical protein
LHLSLLSEAFAAAPREATAPAWGKGPSAGSRGQVKTAFKMQVNERSAQQMSAPHSHPNVSLFSFLLIVFKIKRWVNVFYITKEFISF